MKKYLKQIYIKILWFQVARLRQKHNPIVIAVAGSIGKTGTKTAIATVLGQHLNVQWQSGNYNDITSVPLVFFGQNMPKFSNILAWFKIFLITELNILGSYKYQVVVIELGSDRPGDMDEFKKYLHVDYGVLTSISAEHMENFDDIDAVAQEELTISEIADIVLVDSDAVESRFRAKLIDAFTFGEGPQDCRITSFPLTPNLRRPVKFTLKNGTSFSVETQVLGRQGLPALAAAALLSSKLELTKTEIEKGLKKVKPIAGRMNPVSGKNGSLIIDDTYNSSPVAVDSALKTLYEIPIKNKVAILGQMNEMGKHSEMLHQQVGKLCDPKQLKLVVTIGDDANNYLAEAAEKRGCKVMRTPSPYHAADIVKPLLSKDTIVLVKGSQNGVFAEEAVKDLLANHKDSNKLVRQSRAWLKIKQRKFSDA